MLGRRAIVRRIRKLTLQLGHRPTLEELVGVGTVTRQDIRDNFENYTEALVVAGVMKTKKQLEKERKKRGHVRPWNYNGGATTMSKEQQEMWREFSSEIIQEVQMCQEEGTECHPEGRCSERLVAHHIIPRRCGGEILERRNVVVVCDRAHKTQIADLYWKVREDIDLTKLPNYQLIQLADGCIVEEDNAGV